MRELLVEAFSHSEEETVRFGERLGAALRSRAVVGLTGPLGAGKTRLVQGIARGTGYAGRVRSPSFALLHVYRGRLPLRHFDLYRLESIDEATAGEWEETMEGEGISMIEWADRVPELIPEEAMWIDLVPTGLQDRTIRLRFPLPSRILTRLETPLNTSGRSGRVLALESSGVLAGVALIEGDLLLGEAAIDTRKAPTEHLLTLAGRLLDDLGLGVPDLDRLAISEGPGSFTGLRVGMASALGMAIGSHLRVVPVGSLEVLAYPWRLCEGVIVPVSGFRRGQLYFAGLRWDGIRFKSLLDPVSAPLETMFERCASLESERLLFVGDALDSLAGLIRSRLGERACPVSVEPPRASSLARLGQDSDRPAWTGTELEGRTPRYLRDADARKPRPRPRP